MTINRRTFLAAASKAWVRRPRSRRRRAVLAAMSPKKGPRWTGYGLYAENRKRLKLVWRADQRLIMCSTFKASLAACALARVDRGEDRLDAMIAYRAADLITTRRSPSKTLPQARCRCPRCAEAIVEFSDNAFATCLLARIGGPAALTAFWRATGDTVSRLDHNEPELDGSPPGAIPTTPPRPPPSPESAPLPARRCAVAGLTRTSHGWMVGLQDRQQPPCAGGLPKDWKIGEQDRQQGKDASGDIAIAWPKVGGPVLICACTTQGGLAHAAAIRSHLCEIGRMVCRQFG